MEDRKSSLGNLAGMRPTGTWRNKTVFITGANGFLGTHLTRRSLLKNANVIALIKERVPGSLFHRERLDRRVRVIEGRVDDFRLVQSIFKKNTIDVCFHVGAQAIVGIANKLPIETFKSNIEGTWNVLEASRTAGVGALIISSSDKAYGDQTPLPYTEESPLLAVHPYDASKACMDILGRTYAQTYGVPIAVTRCANIYGPGDVNLSRLIPDVMRAVLMEKNPLIRSDGTPVRDYVFINDIVDAYVGLAERLSAKTIPSGEAFNFGTGKPVSVLSLVKTIIKISGKMYLKPVVLGKSPPRGEIHKQFLSSRKASALLGWKPVYSLEKGLRRTYHWHKMVMGTAPYRSASGNYVN